MFGQRTLEANIALVVTGDQPGVTKQLATMLVAPNMARNRQCNVGLCKCSEKIRQQVGKRSEMTFTLVNCEYNNGIK